MIHAELLTGLRVLLVDDDPVDRMAVVRALRQLGVGVEVTEVDTAGAVQDVTAQKREEAATRRRLEFEQQLIGIVSHDLRQPISGMVSGVESLRERLAADPRLAPVAARIVASGERASRLLDDLLDFTHIRTGYGLRLQKRATDIHELCRRTVDALALAHPGRGMILKEKGAGQGVWDPERIGQVIGNLVRNALGYSPQDTPVTVRTLGLDDRVSVEVHNHNLGEGIPVEVQGTLFQPFQRTDRRHDRDRRIGLGLFLAREIVIAHGGSIDVRSTADEGTTFRLELPRAQG